MKIKTITISLFVIALLGLIGYRVFSNTEESAKNNKKGDKK